MIRTIRELLESELYKYVDYVLNLSPDDDLRMGIDRKSVPSREQWIKSLIEDSRRPLQTRQFSIVGFFLDGKAIGHANLNKIIYGKEGSIHLHLWLPPLRKQGLGTFYLIEAMYYYFEKFKLQKIIHEPNIDNPAPHRMALKNGFSLVDSYRTKPSTICYEHQVNRYEITKVAFFNRHFPDL